MANPLVRSKKKKALEFFQAGDLARAEPLLREACRIDPRDADAWEVLGAIHGRCGRYAQAADCCLRAIDLRPQSAQAHSNLGNAYRYLNRPEEALRSYERAISINPGYVAAHYNRGAVLLDMSRLDEAIASLRHTIQLKPDYAEAYSVLGTALYRQGQIGPAVENGRRAVLLQPGSEYFRRQFVAVLQHHRFLQMEPDTLRAIELCFQTPRLDHQNMAGAIVSALRLDPGVKRLLHLASGEDQAALGEAVLARQFVSAFDNRLFLLLLRNTVNVDLDFERLLIGLRRLCLDLACQPVPSMPAWLLADHPGMICAMACQCFNNEYIWDCSEQESRQLQGLSESIENALAGDKTLLTAALLRQVAVYGMYRELSGLRGAALLMESVSVTMPAPVQEVITRQVAEPLREQSLRKSIGSLTSFENDVSLRVKDQYEQSPYPRWISVDVNSPQPLAEVLQSFLPGVTATTNEEGGPTRILIAGCGTGRHAVYTATRFANSEVTAIDLSRSSLAYAMRKCDELGIRNVRFFEADILGLAGWPERFDLVESAGTLQCMDDPLQGLNRLCELLKPGGWLRLGLYSTRARRTILEARSLLHSRGFAPTREGIRQARRYLLDLGKSTNPEFGSLTKAVDFFSVSDFRDLLLHVREICHTIPEIKTLMVDAGLVFAGFEHHDLRTMQRFRSLHPNPEDLANLDAWHDFEQQFPDTFAGMYQFWCRRKESIG